jgi:cyclopropane-fatty-acyl-phospholipid synthase
LGAREALTGLFNQNITDARILLRTPAGDIPVGRDDGRQPDVTVRVHRERFFSRVLGYGNLGMGEAFIDGDFDIEQGSLPEFLTILLRNRVGDGIERRPLLLARAALIRLRGLVAGAPRSVRAHYDLGPDLFRSFLDDSLSYSCGYALTPGDSLEQLQRQKLDRICRKLRLAPGMRVLDIGCGFGGLLIHAATHHGVQGVGVTLSHDQRDLAMARIAAAGLADRLSVRLCDYAEVSESFDRVVSVGMVEHLRASRYGDYFRHIARALSADGIGLVHGISRTTARNSHDPFIQKYVFPRSSTPSLSELAGRIERCGMAIVDVENIGPHYAPTLRAWLERFLRNRDGLDHRRYDLPFQRMWEYYLSCGTAAAVASDGAVFQVLFTKKYPSDSWCHRV